MAAAAKTTPNHALLVHDSEKQVKEKPWQHWHYDGTYITGLDGRVLDVNEGSNKEGTTLIVYDKKPGNHPNQQWDYKDGSFVTRMGTGFVIDVAEGKVANGSQLILWRSHGGSNQKWDIDHFGFLRTRANTSFVVDLNGGAGKGAGKVTLWQGPSPATVELAKKLQYHQHQRWHYDGKTGFISAFDGRVLDVTGNDKSEGAAVILYDKKPENSPNQQWDYKDGSFVSRMGTGFVLDVKNGNIANGGELITWRSHGGTNQKWDIDAYGCIRSRANPKLGLDVNGGPVPAKGSTKVTLWTVGHLLGGL